MPLKPHPHSEKAIKTRQVNRSREFIEYSDGSKWTRKVDAKNSDHPTSDWTKVEEVVTTDNDDRPERQLQPTASDKTKLSIILEHQAEGEPKHWCLFAYREHIEPSSDTLKRIGQVWQVTGDAEFMHFEHYVDIDRFQSGNSLWYSRVVNADLSEEQEKMVDEIARGETPPRAKSRREVKENCQGWTVKVLKRLVEEGVVNGGEGHVGELEGVMDPV